MSDNKIVATIIGVLVSLAISFGLGIFVGHWSYYWQGWEDGQKFYITQSRQVYYRKETTQDD